MPAPVTITLHDRLGYPIDQIAVPEPLPVVVFHAERAYMRMGVKSTDYREVTSYVSPDTASGSFKVIKQD